MSSVKSLLAVNLGPVVLGVFSAFWSCQLCGATHATSVNTYFYGVVSFQYGSYATTKFNDPLWIKATVTMLFLLDSFHSASLIWMVWVYTVESFGDFFSLATPIWPYPLTIVITALTAFVTQFFLSYRTYRLTQRKLLYFGSILVELGTLALGIFCAVEGWKVQSLADLPNLRPFLSTWLCLEMAVDVIICATLLYILSRSRSGFAQSDTIVRRLMRAAVQTGFSAGIFAVVTLILFLTKADTQLYSLTGIPISRVYSNTLMDTILCRGELRDLVRQQQTDGTPGKNHSTYRGIGSTTPSIQLHIHKEVHTDYEGTDSYAMQPPSTPRQKTNFVVRSSDESQVDPTIGTYRKDRASF